MSEISLFIVKHCYVIAASKQTIIIPKNNTLEAMAWYMTVASKQKPSIGTRVAVTLAASKQTSVKRRKIP